MADQPQLPSPNPNEDFDVADPGLPAPEAAEPAPPAEPPAEPPARRAHSPMMVGMALDMGLSEGEINSYSPEQLESVLRAIVAQQRSERSKPAAPQPEPKDEGPDWGLDDDGKPLTEKDYLPAVARTIKRDHERDKELKELRNALKERDDRDKQREQTEAQRQHASLLEQADLLFGSREEVFGKGTVSDLDPQSLEFKRRAKVWELMQAPTAKGSLKQRFEEVTSILFGQSAPAKTVKPVDPYEAELASFKEKWKRGGVANPSHRETRPEPNGNAKAVKAVQAKLKDAGFDLPAFTETEEDELPG